MGGVIIPLFKISFKQLLLGFNIGGRRGRTKSYSALLPIFLVAGLMLYIGGIYSFSIGSVLYEMDQLSLIIPLMWFVALLLPLTFSILGASSYLFASRDTDLLFSLPISPASVFVSKILAFYAENLVFTVFLLGPMVVIYQWFTGFSLLFTVYCIVAILATPLFHCGTGAVFGYLVALLTSKVGKGSIFMTIFNIILFVAVMSLSFSMSAFIPQLEQGGEGVSGFFKTYLPFLSTLETGLVTENIFLVGIFVLLAVGIFCIISYILSRNYPAIISSLQSAGSGKAFVMSSQQHKSAFSALYKKEVGRYLRTSIYLINTAFAMVMLILFTGFTVVNRQQLFTTLVPGIDITGYLPHLTITVLCLLCGMCCTTYCSISLEGKSIWILKESPVSVFTILAAKIALNLTLTVPTALICASVLIFNFRLSYSIAVSALLLPILASLYCSVQGIIFNLLLPKMDAINDTVAVKQSTASLLGLITPMAVIIGLCYIYTILGLPLELYCLVCGGFFVTIIAAELLFLKSKAHSLFMAL